MFAAVFGWAGWCHAEGLFTFNDMEKPKPQFTRSADEMSAKFIPRAKSTSVEIRFGVAAGGRLKDVRGVDFDQVDRPEVDEKNFKSAAFEILVEGVAPGGEAVITAASDFFTSATAFYVFNSKLATPWQIPRITNSPLKERVRELKVVVKDGGPLDGDGAVDGKISLTGGPRDSFWGYALGTLFIRFFGIFLVLSVLMVGMMLSGVIFKRLERGEKRRLEIRSAADQENQGEPEENRTAASSGGPMAEADDEEAAAIALALSLHFSQKAAGFEMDAVSGTADGAGWAAAGRVRGMGDRLMVFRRSR